MDFKYALGPHFDRSKVKGRVALLLSLAQENYLAAQALEVASSGRLHHVVVDDEKVGKELLKSKLEKRVNLIPLNKVTTFPIAPHVCVTSFISWTTCLILPLEITSCAEAGR